MARRHDPCEALRFEGDFGTPTAAELLAAGCNLDRKNPRAKEDITHLPPEQLAQSVLEKEQRIAEIVGNIRKLLARHGV